MEGWQLGASPVRVGGSGGGWQLGASPPLPLPGPAEFKRFPPVKCVGSHRGAARGDQAGQLCQPWQLWQLDRQVAGHHPQCKGWPAVPARRPGWAGRAGWKVVQIGACWHLVGTRHFRTECSRKLGAVGTALAALPGCEKLRQAVLSQGQLGRPQACLPACLPASTVAALPQDLVKAVQKGHHNR